MKTYPMEIITEGLRLHLRCLRCGAHVTVAHLRSTSALLFQAHHKHEATA